MGMGDGGSCAEGCEVLAAWHAGDGAENCGNGPLRVARLRRRLRLLRTVPGS